MLSILLNKLTEIFFFTEKEILDRNEEKNELAKALSRSYEELQKARTASAQVNKHLWKLALCFTCNS